MMTLPRLTPQETPTSVRTPGPQAFAKSHTIAYTHPGSAKTSGLSLSWDSSMSNRQSAPNTASGTRNLRLDPLHPPKSKQTIYLETTKAHYQNELQTYSRKREQYHRFHRSWMRPFYGDKFEQEDYRRSIRANLKDQMSEKMDKHKKWMSERIRESETAAELDNKCINADKEQYKKTKLYLMKFRDDNKKIMEDKEKEMKANRAQQYDQERELLRYTPINWSKSLR